MDVHGGLSQADLEMRPFELLSVVCTLGGVQCPLISSERAQSLVAQVRAPGCRIRFVTDADEVPFYPCRDWAATTPQAVFNRKRDLDVLRELGMAPGATTRARCVYERLFAQVSTLVGLCAYDTTGWEGCGHARGSAYAGVRERGAGAVVEIPGPEEIARRKELAVAAIRTAERLVLQPHIFMCICCDWAGGEGGRPRGSDDIYEVRRRMEDNPDIEITLTEADLCMVCGSCDGLDTASGHCVHGGGLVRNFHKNLTVFQKLGLMPGDTLPARKFADLLFERIHSTREVCGYGDGIVTSPQWSICGGPEGNPGYEKTRRRRFV